MPDDVLNSLSPPPAFDATRCAGGSDGLVGCRACVETCPFEAIRARQYPGGTTITIDAWACRRCGACTAACPASALERAFDPEPELRAAVEAAVADAGEGALVALGCAATAARLAGRDGLAAVALRSILTVDETLLVHALRAGASGVAVMPCASCDHGAAALLSRPVELARSLLADEAAVAVIADDASTAVDEALTALAEARGGHRHLEPVTRPVLRERATRREALAALLDDDLAPQTATLPPELVTFGEVTVDAEACSMCGACARTCPTNALGLDPAEGRLTFRGVDCVACGLCAQACPEDGALSLTVGAEHAEDLGERRTLVDDAVVRCAGCGDPYLPARLLAHAQRLVTEATGALPATSRQLELCPSCKEIDPGGAARTAVNEGPAEPAGVGRRGFLKALGATTAGAALLPLLSGRPAAASAPEDATPDPTKRWGMVIDLERCIGCHACTNICKAENQVPLGAYRDWVEEHELGSGTHEARPYFLPKLCNQCDDPWCLRACPTGAIYRRADGIIDLDSSICLACQACMHACPYAQTFYNPARNTADKCNFCSHRIDAGLRPACVDICPSQCRIFGDLNDPDSPASKVLAGRETTGLRQQLGLGPNVRYVGLPGELDR